MKIRPRSIVVIIILAVAIIAAAITYKFWPKRPKVDMSVYVPASTMIYVEVTDIPNLLNGLTSTTAWKKLAPVLGISNQLNYLGDIGSFAAATGMGSQEAVVLARSQVAICLSSIEANGEEVKPRFAMIIKTHSDKSQVSVIAERRVVSLARYKYGPDPQTTTSDYAGVPVTIYTKPGTEGQIVSAVVDDLMMLGNNTASIYACIDTALKRAPSLSENPDLRRTRHDLGDDPVIFAFAGASGISRLTQFGAYIFSQGHITPDDLTDSINKITGDIANGTLGGIGYSASFDHGLVVDRYLLAMKPDVSAKLRDQLKPGNRELQALTIAPPGVDLTVINVQQPAQAFEQLMAAVSSHVNVVTSAALRQLVLIMSDTKFGLDPNRPIGPALGNEIALLGWPGDEEPAIAIEVSDQSAIAPVLRRYLQGNPKHPAFVADQRYQEIEYFTAEDRAGAFLGRFAILGTKEQLMKLIDNWKTNKSISNDSAVREDFQSHSAKSVIQSYDPNQADTGDTMLKVATLLRVSDGNPETLNRPEVHAALQQTAPLVSFTTLNDVGVYTESRSALGRFTLFSYFLNRPEERAINSVEPPQTK